MKSIYFNQPHQLFFASIPLICLLASILPTKTIDLQIHDTYTVLALIHLAIPTSIILAGIGLLYWLFRYKKMLDWMILFHTSMTILPILLFFIWFGLPIEEAANNYIEGDAITRYWFYLIFLLLFLFGQILFVVNLLIALFNKNDNG